MYYFAALSLLWGIAVSGMSEDVMPTTADAKTVSADGSVTGDFSQGLTVRKDGIVRSDAAFREITYQIDKLESLLRRKPGILDDENDLIRDLRRRRNLARQSMEKLSRAPEGSRGEAQASFNTRMNALLESLSDARLEFMSEKEAHRWGVEVRLKQMKDKIDDLASRVKRIKDSAEKENLENSLESLESKKTYVQSQMRVLAEAEEELWPDLRADLESMLEDLESTYLDSRSQVERLEKTPTGA